MRRSIFDAFVRPAHLKCLLLTDVSKPPHGLTISHAVVMNFADSRARQTGAGIEPPI